MERFSAQPTHGNAFHFFLCGIETYEKRLTDCMGLTREFIRAIGGLQNIEEGDIGGNKDRFHYGLNNVAKPSIKWIQISRAKHWQLALLKIFSIFWGEFQTPHRTPALRSVDGLPLFS